MGLVVNRFGLSAIPAYLLAGILLGPNEPQQLSLIEPSEVTDFVATLGLIFLLFFLGLEFSFSRLVGTGRHVVVGGAIDLVVNAGLGAIVGVVAFGFSFAALVLAVAIYVSSSALTFVVVGLLAARFLTRPLDSLLDRLPREFFLLLIAAFVAGAAALAAELGLSEAIGALLAGVVLAETSVRGEIEERFFSFRDLFGALFFFVFGLSIDVDAIGNVGWLLALAIPLTVAGKIGGGYLAGLVGEFSRRGSFNAGVALVAHGEFTIIVAQLAASNPQVSPADRADLLAFAGLYVLATATIGIVLMKESKRLGRRLLRPRLAPESA